MIRTMSSMPNQPRLPTEDEERPCPSLPLFPLSSSISSPSPSSLVRLSRRLLAIISNAIAVSSDCTAASFDMRIFSNARLASCNFSMKGAWRLSQRAGFSTMMRRRRMISACAVSRERDLDQSGEKLVVDVLTANIRMLLHSPLRQPNMRRDMEHESF